MEGIRSDDIQSTCSKCICTNERVKMMGAINGLFPDMGGHIPHEMGGLWAPPIKLLDGFWLKIEGEGQEEWLVADSFEGWPWKNVFQYHPQGKLRGISITRTDLAPDDVCGISVSYEIHNGMDQEADLNCSFLARANLRPEWLGEENGMADGSDKAEYVGEERHFHVYDTENPWHMLLGTDSDVKETHSGQLCGPEVNVGAGIDCQMDCPVRIPAGGSREIRFFVAGSCKSLEDCREQERLLHLAGNAEQQKKERFESVFRTCDLESGDEDFDHIFQWIKAHIDWMTLKYEPVGRGITAGLPEFRWWFGCDSFYTIQGLLPLGMGGLVRDTLELLLKYSRKINGDGQIIHELLPNEVCPNKGNVQETAQFVTAVWQYYQWTADRSFVEEAYDYCEKAVRWLQRMDEDGDGFPTGYGLIEINGLNMEMIDCAVYTCQAYDSFAGLSGLMGKKETAETYEELAGWLREKINQDFWDEEEGLYCDCMGTGQMIASIKEEMLQGIRNEGQEPVPDIVSYLEKRLERAAERGNPEEAWLVNRNSIIDVPMETEIADWDKAVRALDRMYSEEFVGRYGVWLDSLGRRECMTITTGIMAVAQAGYGYCDRALELVKKIFSAFSYANPGCISEYSPEGGCIVQAWTAYSAAVPIVRHFFGIRPNAAKGEILLQPQPPKGWEHASLKNVPVLDGEISIFFSGEGQARHMKVVNTTSVPVRVWDCWTGSVSVEG